jgi:acyl carrier protein|tara:strand:- start:484 stop:735 length:252 start_codon:yes stop_codon:yes gene_type:complete
LEPLQVSVYDHIAKILAEEYEVDEAVIRPDASMAELGLDSLMVVEFLFCIEDEFEIEVPEERAEFATLGEAAALVDTLIAEKG